MTSRASLEQLIFPLDAEEFLNRYWAQEFVHLQGPSERFAALFPWEQLSRALEQHRMLPPRMVLVRNGRQLDANSYQHSGPGRIAVGRLRAKAMQRALAEGATLVLNEVEEVYPKLNELASALERVFRTEVHLNLYAAWRADNGFQVHFDAQDTLILQVSGKKLWRVWKPTRINPLMTDIQNPPKPDSAPVWDGVLQSGCLLHIPRGWWHVACPVNEPSLHLTVTVRNSCGVDLLHWLAGELRASTVARSSLPSLATPLEQQAYLDALFQELRHMWTFDLIERYLADSSASWPARPEFGFPSLDPSTTPPVAENGNPPSIAVEAQALQAVATQPALPGG